MFKSWPAQVLPRPSPGRPTGQPVPGTLLREMVRARAPAGRVHEPWPCPHLLGADIPARSSGDAAGTTTWRAQAGSWPAPCWSPIDNQVVKRQRCGRPVGASKQGQAQAARHLPPTTRCGRSASRGTGPSTLGRARRLVHGLRGMLLAPSGWSTHLGRVAGRTSMRTPAREREEVEDEVNLMNPSPIELCLPPRWVASEDNASPSRGTTQQWAMGVPP